MRPTATATALTTATARAFHQQVEALAAQLGPAYVATTSASSRSGWYASLVLGGQLIADTCGAGSPAEALAQLRAHPALTAPVVYATGQQKEDLIRLYNHPAVRRAEKTKMQLSLDRYTQAQAEQMLADGLGTFRQEIRRREATSRGMVVSGEAFTVAPARAA